jgi:AbrB family looped-hinge helix DNA binding protein
MPYDIETTITSKGQVTVPAEIRERLDLRPGDKLRFKLSDSGKLSVEPRPRRSIFEQIEALKLPSLGRPLVQRDIDEAVGQAMDEQVKRLEKATSTGRRGRR